METFDGRERSVVRGLLACTAVGLLLLSACSRGDKPPLGTVSGTVTFDGKPLGDARVIFEPTEGGRASTASTDRDGKYALTYLRKEKGAKVGPHLVRITAANPGILQARYNSQTTLRAEVKPGNNQIDFPLASNPSG
jgi:hypothetical protein